MRTKRRGSRTKIQLLEAKIAELELETRTAKKPAYSEEQAHLHRRLKELQRRHGEFRRLLLGTQLASGPAFAPVPGAEAPFAGLQDAEHQRELAVLRRRLEELESSQQQQLEELGPPLERDQERQERGASTYDSPSQL
ncbi:hypothetical protein SKAU_G00022920 [Synaphobranchus kaupii]|uniref:Uncharacterized protein n=1 Tax=Synaphobranchus kaupii TaxID=118154 RepID=A0A9Q1GC88_SYNKA|nr:hypothetical protein SKAU_G00022920 [Synaphobranchus kaupii]